jgi:short subunit dehydrogenase-like uncharacterized protein
VCLSGLLVSCSPFQFGRVSQGFTGKLVAQYLAVHHERASFTFALAARSEAKLQHVKEQLSLWEDVELICVDVTNLGHVQEAVSRCRVVINTVGPYHRYVMMALPAYCQYAEQYPVDGAGLLYS